MRASSPLLSPLRKRKGEKGIQERMIIPRLALLRHQATSALQSTRATHLRVGTLFSGRFGCGHARRLAHEMCLSLTSEIQAQPETLSLPDHSRDMAQICRDVERWRLHRSKAPITGRRLQWAGGWPSTYSYAIRAWTAISIEAGWAMPVTHARAAEVIGRCMQPMLTGVIHTCMDGFNWGAQCRVLAALKIRHSHPKQDALGEK